MNQKVELATTESMVNEWINRIKLKVKKKKNFSAVSVQFQSCIKSQGKYRAILEQLQGNFRANLGQFRGNFSVVSVQF